MKLIPNNLDNCVLTNALQRNIDSNDDRDIMYLASLKSIDQQTVSDYFTRSTRIINKMRELGIDNSPTWDDVYLSYAKFIIIQIQQQNFDAVIPAIEGMISSLESQYGVV
tara:strand:+ start:340 stop:669 length:330 start_codon:yes stop_codon:yes gene_type:complete